MVEYTIQHHLQATPMRLVEQGAEGSVAAQQRIDLVVIVGMVAMVRGRLEDRSEVDRRRAKRLNVIEMLDYAQQVAAFVALNRRRAIPGLKIARLGQLVALREAVGENLVEDGVLDPAGGLNFGHS